MYYTERRNCRHEFYLLKTKSVIETGFHQIWRGYILWCSSFRCRKCADEFVGFQLIFSLGRAIMLCTMYAIFGFWLRWSTSAASPLQSELVLYSRIRTTEHCTIDFPYITLMASCIEVNDFARIRRWLKEIETETTHSLKHLGLPEFRFL